MDKRKEDTENADDSGINHGLEGQDVKTHSQLKDIMINILVDIAEIEFIKTLEQKGISSGVSKQLFHKLLDQYSHISAFDNKGNNEENNRDNEAKEHLIIEIIEDPAHFIKGILENGWNEELFSQINDLQGKVLKNAADKITQILMQDGIDFEVANDIGTNLAMVELDKLQEKYEQMENIVNSVKEPKDIWNLLLGHVLGGTKSQSALVLKEFIKKRVTPWVDFTTDLLVLIALYEQDDIGNVENNDGNTTNINSDFWTGIALFVSPWLIIFMSLAFSVVWPLMWRVFSVYVMKGKAWKSVGSTDMRKVLKLSIEERREMIKQWFDRNFFFGIKIFPKWLPLGPIILIAVFIELLLSLLILFFAYIAYFIVPYFWSVILLLISITAMLLAVIGKCFHNISRFILFETMVHKLTI